MGCGFGASNCFPRKFGGGTRPYILAWQAMLDALAPGWDVDEEHGGAVRSETYGHALAIGTIWAINTRVQNQMVPLAMMETLRTWETALRLRPAPSDYVQTRRARVAAKFRGYVGNTIGDLYDTCAAIGRVNFVGFKAAMPADVVAYRPGLAPGPPGFEFTSIIAYIAIVVQQGVLGDTAFLTLISDLQNAMAAQMPAWMGCQIGVDAGGFIVGDVTPPAGIIGLTFL